MPISTPIRTTRETAYDGSSITTSVDTGTESDSRVILALVVGRDGNTVSGGTFGGVAATVHHTSVGDGGFPIAIVSAAVPSGSGAQNCVLNFSSWGAGACELYFYAFDGVDTAPESFDFERETTPGVWPTPDLVVSEGAIVFGAATHFQSEYANNFNGSTQPLGNLSRYSSGGLHAVSGYLSGVSAGSFVVAPDSAIAAIAISFAPLASAGGTYDEEIALGSGLGVTTTHNAALAAAVTLASQLATTGSAAATLSGSVSLGATLDLGHGAERQIAEALAFAMSAALASDATLTIDQALALAASAGLTSSAAVTMEAVAALAVDLSAALNDALDGRTFEEALALGLSMLIAKAAQQDMSSTLDMGVQAGHSAASTATQGAEMALASALQASAGAALDIAAAMTLDAEAGMILDGRRIVEGSISFPAAFDSAAVSGAVLNGGLTFRAAFDQVATSILTADEAVALAIETTLGTGVITGNIVVGTVALDGTITRSVRIDGVRTDTSDLTGTMDLTIRLNGRLN